MNYRIYQGPTKILDFEAEDREAALEKALNWSGLSLMEITEEEEPEQEDEETESEEAYLAKDGRQP